ncbi:histone-fold-containing protein [Meredithblackwellia eburnea MCA 4105]
MPRKKVEQQPESEQQQVEEDGIEHYDLPKSIVTRMAKNSVPAEVKMQKDIPVALVKGSTVFVNYLAAVAHDVATERNQKTITAAHVLDAVKQLGWEDEQALLKHLKGELNVYRKAVEAKKNGKAAPPPKKAAPSKDKETTAKGKSASTKPSSFSSKNVTAPSEAMAVDEEGEGGEEDPVVGSGDDELYNSAEDNDDIEEEEEEDEMVEDEPEEEEEVEDQGLQEDEERPDDDGN